MYIAQQNSAVLYIEVLTKITVVPLLYLKSDGLVELGDPACCASNTHVNALVRNNPG